MKTIRVKQTIQGLPDWQFMIARGLENTSMVYPDRKTVLYGYTGSYTDDQAYDKKKFMPAIRLAIKDFHLVNPYDGESFTAIFTLPADQYNNYKGRIGQYQATAHFDFYQYIVQPIGSLRASTMALLDREHVTILDVRNQSTGVTVLVEEKNVNLFFDRPDPQEFINQVGEYWEDNSFKKVYVLRNLRRKEAFLMEPISQSIKFPDMRISFFSRRVSTKVKHLDFNYINNRIQGLPIIDEQWLRDAELVRLKARLIGTQSKEIRYRNFYLPEKSTERNIRSGSLP